MIDIEERTQEDILKSINDAGYTIGHNSLTMLLNGSCFQAGMFEIIDVRFDPKKKTETPKTVVTTVTPTTPEPAIAAPMTPQHSPKMETVEKKVAREVIKQVSKAPKQKSGRVVSKESSELPDPVLVGSKNAKMFGLLARPEGATREEIMTELGWSPSCFASIIYTVPKSKGYAIFAEKTEDSALHYHLYFVGGAGKVLPEQVQYRERKGSLHQQTTTHEDDGSKQEAIVVAPTPKTMGSPTRRASDVKDSSGGVVASMQTNIAAMAEKMAQHFHPR